MLKHVIRKQSKTQISLIAILGLMICGQMGFVLYKGDHSPIVSEKRIAQAGSAKAFGLVVPQEKNFQVSSVKELDRVFHHWNYNLTKTKSNGKVPRLYLAKFPQDMRHKEKSSNATFIQVLLPHILKVNEQILADRKRLIAMNKQSHLRRSEKAWLIKLASDYRCKSTKIESLLMHVDIVPPSLALAQGIIETGGGRSHAAVRKNSTFGHMRTKTDVAKFASLLDNVKAYATNLNRHAAYASFRKERAKTRTRNQEPSGYQLASYLTKYSERGVAYTRDLQNLIQSRSLAGYDKMTLEQQRMRLKP